MLETPEVVLTFTYTNWRGKTSRRRVRPIGTFYGVCECYHPEEKHYFLRCSDLDRGGAERDFRIDNMVNVKEEPCDSAPK
jgi:hypothetical protein